MKKPFDRVITVMFENQYRGYVIQNPFLKKLAAAGADMTNYFGAFHPSQTNYLASLSGEVCDVTNDDPPLAPLLQDTLVDLMEAKDVSWKAYMEAYPGEAWNKAWVSPTYPKAEAPMLQNPTKPGELARYYRKHNAFASFHNIQKDENRWNKIVSDVDFWQDVAKKTLPEYSWFTPDIWNDGHYLYNTHIDTNPRTELVPQLSAWLEHVFLGKMDTTKIVGGAATGLPFLGLNLDVDLLLTDPKAAWAKSNVPPRTLIVVTFDEADFNAVKFDTMYDGPNQVYTVLLGDMIEPGTTIDTPYNHYNLIRTVEENFQLGSLNKNDLGANWFRFLWDESFVWDKPVATQISAGTGLAITNGLNGEHLVFTNPSGQLFESFLGATGWSQPNELGGVTARGDVAMASLNGTDFLVTKASNDDLILATYDAATKKWADSVSIGPKSSGHFALTAYNDMAAAEHKLMLCWTDENGFINSMEGNEKGFSGKVVPVNHLTDGPMTLSQIGASLFLVYKERNTRKMRITSFNVGEFNKINAVDFDNNAAPENNTTLHEWSATDYSVGHFSKKMAALANEYQNLGNMAMATVAGEMHLVQHSGYADKNNAYTEIFGLTGIYSAANQLSNGYGTLNQAGWTTEEEMTQVAIGPLNPLAMCSNDEKLTLVWVDFTTGTINYRQGGYVAKKKA